MIPPDSTQQVFGVALVVVKMLSPLLIPVFAVLIFLTTLKITIERLLQVPTDPGGGFLGRIAKRKILVFLLFAEVSAFLVWLSFQPADFRAGFLFPFELLGAVITSNIPLYTLAATLGAIALVVLFL